MDFLNYEEPKKGFATNLILAGQPGVGKSSLIAGLNKNGYKALHIDLQGGALHIGGYVKDINKIAAINRITVTDAFFNVLTSLRKQNIENKAPLFDFVVYDPLICLKPIIETYATFLYNNSAVGKGVAAKLAKEANRPNDVKAFMSSNVLNDMGQNGWSYMNQAWTAMKSKMFGLSGICDIIIAHTKYNQLRKTQITEVAVKEIDFYNNYLLDLIGSASDSGMIYRQDNQVKVSFKFNDDHSHFKSRWYDNEDFVLSTKDENGIIAVDWSPIFPFINEPKQ